MPQDQRDLGIRFVRRETWRAPERQAYLFQQGRSRPGALVTTEELLDAVWKDVAVTLPAWKAFVVQFSRETERTSGCSGRVQHLRSGRQARFESAAELLAALDKLLAEVGVTDAP